MQGVRRVVQYLYFPLFVFCLDGVICIIVFNKYPALLLLPTLSAGLLLSTLAERFIPYCDDFNTPRDDVLTDTWHAVVNECEWLILVAILPLIVSWSTMDLWPKHWSPVGQLLFAIMVTDFGVWVAHFASHKFQMLWRFHAVHHSVTRFYSFNGLMKHPMHLLIEQAPGAALLIGLGIPHDVSIALVSCIFIQLLMQHSNVDYRIGIFEYILSTNAVHRFHHVRDPVLGNCNYGLFTNVWDLLFGTFRFASDRKFSVTDLGLVDSPDYPRDYIGHLLAPFGRVRPSPSSNLREQ